MLHSAILRALFALVVVASTVSAQTCHAPWLYLQPPVIDSVTPSWGQYGSLVTIHGSNLLAGGSSFSNITLAGVSVTQIVSFNDSNVVVQANGFATSANVTGDVFLQTDTHAIVSRANAWTYVKQGVISSVTPTVCQSGTYITISGTGLSAAGRLVTATLAGVNASIISANDTRVILRAARHRSR